MRIRKDPKTRNEYILAGDVWVRNFWLHATKPLDPNNMFNATDMKLAFQNEQQNSTTGKANIADETLSFRKIVIVSDGLGFEDKFKTLLKFPSDVFVIAINKSLKKWPLKEPTRPINLYVANNPYEECSHSINKSYYPSCIASTRTNPQFIKSYKGSIYLYQPAPVEKFGVAKDQSYCIDDYRNPVCAAIGLAYRFGVRKLMLLGCDDSFKESRPSAVQLDNGLWTYPQQLKSQDIIDANLHWLTKQPEVKIEVADYSCGREYQNAVYIKSEEDAIKFFSDAVIEAGGLSG